MKTSIWVTGLIILTLSAAPVFAQPVGPQDENQGQDTPGTMEGQMMRRNTPCEGCEGMMGKKMMHKGMMGKGMKGCPMMKSMMERKIVATQDGGIVVAIGNQITKYDKNMNVVKEVTLKVDMEGMQRMMRDMKAKCPMMEQMMDAPMEQPDN